MTDDGAILLLTESNVSAILAERELDIMRVVRDAYIAHAKQETSLPYSSFLTFPDSEINRIIALPAYLGSDFETAGIKWISSFPGNRERRLNRASAIILLNSVTTGRVETLMEGAIISAQRTAASAALTAKRLLADCPRGGFGFIGCGLINRELLRFLRVVYPSEDRVLLYDHTAERANQFATACSDVMPDLRPVICKSIDDIFTEAQLVSIATTAIRPHIVNIPRICDGQVVLHLSLRDIVPEIILESYNIVDDIHHVCRANTSIHLAEQLVGHRAFVKATVADVLSGEALERPEDGAATIVSPFGLGVLDIAVAKFVKDAALERGIGLRIESFFADSD